MKLQASYNPFESLPDDMWDLPALELFRLAVGDLRHWPAGLGEQHTHRAAGFHLALWVNDTVAAAQRNKADATS